MALIVHCLPANSVAVLYELNENNSKRQAEHTDIEIIGKNKACLDFLLITEKRKTIKDKIRVQTDKT